MKVNVNELYSLCENSTDMKHMDIIISSIKVKLMNKENFFQFARERLIDSCRSDNAKQNWERLLKDTYIKIWGEANE